MWQQRRVSGFVFALVWFAWTAAGYSAPYNFSSPAGETVRKLIASSIEARKLGKRDSALKIIEIETAFRRVDRSAIPTDDSLELQFLAAVWRYQTQRHLILGYDKNNAGSLREVMLQLRELALTVSRADLEVIAAAVDPFAGKPEYEQLYADWGRLLATRGVLDAQRAARERRGTKPPSYRVGPLYFASDVFKPVAPTAYGNTGWVDKATDEQLDALADYDFPLPDLVEYRGLLLRTGDVVMLKQNYGPDGLNSSFSIPRSCFTHSAQIVFLRRKGRTIPAVLEIHTTGLRFVPLNYYLDEHVADYLEIYRYHQMDFDWEEKVTAVMDKLAYQPFAYDYLAQEIEAEGDFGPRKRCVNCSSMIDLVFKQSGKDLEFAPAIVTPEMADTLKKVDEPFVRYLNPTDIMRSPKMRFVGAIDNGNIAIQIAKETVFGGVGVAGSLGELLSTHEIDLSKVPLKSAAIERLVKRINENRTGSDWVQWASGFTPETFPEVPAKAFAAITAFDESNQAAAKAIAASTAVQDALEADEPFSLHAFETSEAAKDLREKEMGAQRGLLKAKGAADGRTISARRLVTAADVVLTYVVPSFAAPVFVLEDFRRHATQNRSLRKGAEKTWQDDAAFVGIYTGGSLTTELARYRWLTKPRAIAASTGKTIPPPTEGSGDSASPDDPAGPGPQGTPPTPPSVFRRTLSTTGTVVSFATGVRQAGTLWGLGRLTWSACRQALCDAAASR